MQVCFTGGSWKYAVRPSWDSPNTSRRFALGACNVWLVGENPTCSVPAYYGCEGQWSYDYGHARISSTPPAPRKKKKKRRCSPRAGQEAAFHMFLPVTMALIAVLLLVLLYWYRLLTIYYFRSRARCHRLFTPLRMIVLLYWYRLYSYILPDLVPAATDLTTVFTPLSRKT